MGGDCEAIDGWGLAQDVGALSSLGYVVAGVALVWLVARRRLPRPTLLLAAMLVLEGLGSLLAHGVGGPGAGLVHDLALAGVAGYLAGWHLGRLRGEATAGAVWGAMVAAVAVVAAWSLDGPAAGAAIAGAAVAAVAVAEVTARARGAVPVWTGRLLVIAAVAITAWVVGRTGGPLCDPDSLLQFHPVWHLLTAYLVVAWALAAEDAAVEDPKSV